MTGRAIGKRLAVAQARADAARTDFAATLGKLQHRASPQALAQDAADTLKRRGVDALIEFADAAQRKPARTGLGLLLLGLFLGRRPIFRALRRFATEARSPTATSDEGKSIR